MNAPWYIISDGEKKGPYNEAQLRNLLAIGTIDSDTRIWREGMDRWLPVEQVVELAPLDRLHYVHDSPRWFVASRYALYGVLAVVVLVTLLTGLWLLNQWV